MKKLISILLSITLVLTVMVTDVFTLPANAATCSAKGTTLYQKKIELTNCISTNYMSNYVLFPKTPNVVTFVDSKGNYNVVNEDWHYIYIHRYNDKSKLISTLKISHRPTSFNEVSFQEFGNITFDEYGNYYICCGADDWDYDRHSSDVKNKDREAICVSKYNYDGVFLGECKIKGYDAAPFSPGDYWGTQYPFRDGTCSMAVNNGVLACNMARQMYSGHQSNYVFYIDCKTMKQIQKEGYLPYTSHSFDQDCIATSDGGFLMADQGDAYPRSFHISKVDTLCEEVGDLATFHFREGPNRPYGYNDTFAQMGGLAETENAYVFCASSERTLSLDVAPTKDLYYSYSEARDLFVQVLKKDFYNYSKGKKYLVAGTTRKATGKAPKKPKTELWLSEGTTDYGVVWLTDYSDKYFVANPKIVSIGNGKFVVMWEKRYASEHDSPKETPIATYYMIMRDDGTIVKKAKNIGKVGLPSNADVVYHNGSILWVTANCVAGITINMLDLEGHDYVYTVLKKSTCTKKGQAKYICSKCSKEWETCGTISVSKKKHTYDNICDEKCNVCNTARSDAHKYKKYKTIDATTSKDGKKYYKCSECGKKKTKTIYKVSKYKLSATKYAYNGSTKKPSVKIYDSNGKKLTYGEDYTYKRPSSSKNVGKYKIKVTFKGNYSGTKNLYYTINPPETKVSSLTAGKKSLKVQIKKKSSQTSGYEIQYSASKDFTSAKIKKVSGYANTNVTLKSLSAEKTYYVRVRTYKTVNGKKYYSGWSTYKYKKTK